MKIQNIDKKLNKYVQDLNKFKKGLNKNNAIIAGGFILGSVTNLFKINDIDIYINAKNLKNFLSEMDELIIIDNKILSEFENFDFGSMVNYTHNKECKNKDLVFYLSEEETDRTYMQVRYGNRKIILPKHNHYCNFIGGSEYDLSFFNKNGIKFKLSGFLNNIRFDLMVVNDDRNIYDVVSNFDLTCCQVWYDGYKFDGTHIEDIKNKKTNLNKDYVNALINGNKFILKRIKKYQKRGFTIDISVLNSINLQINDKKNIINYEKWLVKSVLFHYYTLFYSLMVNYRAHKKIRSINGLDINVYNSFKIAYIEHLDEFFNIFNYDIYFKEKDLYKFVCKKKCILDYNLKKKENQNQNQCFIIYKTWIEFYNSFINFTMYELMLNVYLYFKLDSFHLIKNGIYKYYNMLDLDDSPSVKKIIDNIKQILHKQEFSKSIINIKKKKNISNKSLSLFKSDKFEDLEKLLKLHRIHNKFELKNFYNSLKTITKEIDINQLIGMYPIMFEEFTIKDYLNQDKGNICIIGLDYNNNIIPNSIIFYDIDDLFIYYNDMRDGWFYECETASMRNILKHKAYVKIPLVNIKLFVDHNDIFNLFEYNIKRNIQIFYYKEIGKINYTISHDNAFNIDANYVSAAHCQEGSSITIHQLYNSKFVKQKALSI